jgi:phosphatidylethanolamine-binding protein (PEBP) family uncharacterized protein
MGVVRRALAPAMLLAGLALAGCGGSSTRPSGISTSQPGSPAASSHREASSAPSESIQVGIPTVRREEENYIPTRYTCFGRNAPLPVRWSRIPPNTAELALFVLNLQPVRGRFFFDWAIAGLKPASHGIASGALPPGVVVGRNSFGRVGYSICPKRGAPEEHYVMRVVALRRPLVAKPGFDAEALYREAGRSATVVGLGGGAYKPPGS